jgi:F-type H+-transporting ATPase subunit delta
MDVGVLAMRYARALIAYACDYEAEDTLYTELSMLKHSFEHEPALVATLDNPVVSVEDKLSLLCTAACGNNTPSPTFLRFMELVLQQKRESYLHSIVLMFLDLYRSLKHIGVARLITAVSVDATLKERIRRKATGVLHTAKMEIETVVDPAIEGGFIFDINSYRLDASIATQLKRVKQQFIEKNKRIV